MTSGAPWAGPGEGFLRGNMRDVKGDVGPAELAPDQFHIDGIILDADDLER